MWVDVDAAWAWVTWDVHSHCDHCVPVRTTGCVPTQRRDLRRLCAGCRWRLGVLDGTSHADLCAFADGRSQRVAELDCERGNLAPRRRITQVILWSLRSIILQVRELQVDR